MPSTHDTSTGEDMTPKETNRLITEIGAMVIGFVAVGLTLWIFLDL
jgi:hypothetical protein